MILGFKTEFPWGEQTFFVDKILLPVRKKRLYFHGTELQPKLHTIRKGQRVRPGQWLHMATGVRTRKYHQFNKGIVELAKCKSVQRFDLTYRSNDVVAIYIDKELKYCRNKDHVFEVEPGWLNTFVVNDGFTGPEQFFRWFKKSCRNYSLIHWTDLKY